LVALYSFFTPLQQAAEIVAELPVRYEMQGPRLVVTVPQLIAPSDLVLISAIIANIRAITTNVRFFDAIFSELSLVSVSVSCVCVCVCVSLTLSLTLSGSLSL
jgi:hypothetical protein